MTEKRDYDDLEEEFLDEEEEGSFLGMMSVAIGFLAIVGFITLAWYAYRTGTESLQVEELEVVKTDAAPLKEAPKDPGGWEFPHQDKTVYETIAARKPGGEEGEKIAAVPVAAPEEPVAREAAEGGAEAWVSQRYRTQAPEQEKPAEPAVVEKTGGVQTENAAATPAAEKSAAEATAEKPPAEPATAPAPAQAQAQEKTAEKLPAAPATTGDARKPETPKSAAAAAPAQAPAAAADKPAAKASPGGGVRVQLGAYTSEKEAKASWEKINKKHGALLSGLSHRIVRADLGAKGVFYRLQLMPFAQGSDARALCDKLSGRKQACLVVKAQ